MIYVSLFLEFLKIGSFAFGGAYGAIPLIQESVLAKGWMDEAMFANVIAISESTPGPIMLNAATYIGNSQAGVLGAIIATLGVVLPSFFIILIVAVFLHTWLKNRTVQAVLKGIKPCLMGIILATGAFMAITVVFGSVRSYSFNSIAFSILVILITVSFIYQHIKKKELSPIILIIISAILGGMLF